MMTEQSDYDTYVATERAAKRAKAAAFRATCEQIAIELRRLDGGPWALAPAKPVNDWGELASPDLIGADGERLDLSIDAYGQRGRIGVSVGWPQLPDGTTWYPSKYRDEASPSITVSADKLPLVIARDIVRRVLPAYRALLGKARETIAGQRSHIDATADTFDRLIAGSGGHLTADRDSTMANRLQRRGNQDLTATLRDVDGVSCYSVRVSGDSVTFERLYVNGAIAARILAAIVGGR